jgi:hypothetical protein
VTVSDPTQQIDLTTRIVNSLVDHWPLLVGLIIASYWVFPRVLKAVLLNGGGDTIRAIMRSETAAQTAELAAVTRTIVVDAIRAHEQVEAEKLRAITAELRREMVDFVAPPRASVRKAGR